MTASVIMLAIKIKVCLFMSVLKLICCACGKRQPKRLPYNLVVTIASGDR